MNRGIKWKGITETQRRVKKEYVSCGRKREREREKCGNEHGKKIGSEEKTFNLLEAIPYDDNSSYISPCISAYCMKTNRTETFF